MRATYDDDSARHELDLDPVPALRTGGLFVLGHGAIDACAIFAMQTLASGDPHGARISGRALGSIAVDLLLGYLLMARIESVRMWALLRGAVGVALVAVVSETTDRLNGVPIGIPIGMACAFSVSLALVLVGTPGKVRLAFGWVLFAAYAIPTTTVLVAVFRAN